MYGLSAVIFTTILIVGRAVALSRLKLRHPVPYVLSIDDVLRSDRSVTDDMGDSVVERLEIKEDQKRASSALRRIHLRTNKREMSISLQPRKTIMSPDLRVTVIDGEMMQQVPVDASLQDLFFHGEVDEVDGVDGGVASLMNGINGWKGIVLMNGEAFAVNHERSTGEHLLIKIVNDDVIGSMPLMQTAEQKARDVRKERNIGRRKRNGAISNLKMELGVYMDQYMYEYIKDNNFDDPIAELQRVALLAVNTADVYYQKPSLGAPVDVVVAKLVIFKKDPADFNVTGGIRPLFNNFCVWEGRYMNPRGLSYDIALLLTGINYLNTKTRAVGMAKLGGACNHFASMSCTISEGAALFSGIVTAHELGHSVGIDHDGENNNCQLHQNIMGPAFGPGATDFSSCSRAYFETYIQQLDDFNNNCLRKDVSEKTVDYEGDLLPGERLIDGEQCKSLFGPAWHDHVEDYQDVTYCSRLLCTNNTYIWKSFAPPMPGSRCAENKICWDAECLDKNVVKERQKWEHNSSLPSNPLTLDEICVKYGSNENYTKGVVYDGTGDSETWRELCWKGLKCRLPDNSDEKKERYLPVPPGTPCYTNKVCKHFRCEDIDSPDKPKDSSDVVEVVENPMMYRKQLSHKTRENMAWFCTTYASETAVPMHSNDCGTMRCEDEIYYYWLPAYLFSICPDGQMCTVVGDCVEDSGKTLPGELTKEELIIADQLCKDAYGQHYQSLCRRPALTFSLSANEYCAGGLCENVVCFIFENWGKEIRFFAPPLGSPCGGGKRCGPKGCSKISIHQSMKTLLKTKN